MTDVGRLGHETEVGGGRPRSPPGFETGADPYSPEPHRTKVLGDPGWRRERWAHGRMQGKKGFVVTGRIRTMLEASRWTSILAPPWNRKEMRGWKGFETRFPSREAALGTATVPFGFKHRNPQPEGKPIRTRNKSPMKRDEILSGGREDRSMEQRTGFWDQSTMGDDH
eukprot:scaffold824_cov327-Pavlova_lutheri.AAC.51